MPLVTLKCSCTTGALAYRWNAEFQDAPVILNDTMCSGTEQSLIECSLNGYGNFDNCPYIAVAICQGIMFWYCYLCMLAATVKSSECYFS